jgi:transposase-like protein
MSQHRKAREKLNAIIYVYFNDRSISSVCKELEISRETWYKWEKQFRTAINRIWGGLARKSRQT